MIVVYLVGIVSILVGYTLGVVASSEIKKHNAKEVGTLYIYKDSVDNADHIHAAFSVGIDEIKKMKDCKFAVDTSLHV